MTRWKLALALSAMLFLAILGNPRSGRAAGPYVPYMGFFYPNEFIGEMVAPYVNLVSAVYGADPIQDPNYAAHIINNNLSVVLGFGFNQGLLLNTDGSLDATLSYAKSVMAPGLLSHVIAVSFGDEPFLALHAGGFDDPIAWPDLAPLAGDRVAQANRLRDRLTAALAIIKAHFPGAYTTITNPFWNDLLDYGTVWYAPAPGNLDVLSLDPYFGFGTLNMRLCDAGTKAAWDGHVGGILNRAIARFPQPILLVGQAFRHERPPQEPQDWPAIPAPCQLEWWYQLALAHPSRVPGILWFAYGYNMAGGIVDGVRDPAHAAELQKLTEIFVRNYNNRF